jgi:hypothetical protein
VPAKVTGSTSGDTCPNGSSGYPNGAIEALFACQPRLIVGAIERGSNSAAGAPIALCRGLATRQGMRERSPVEKARIARSEPDRHVERHDRFARRLVAMEQQRRQALRATHIIKLRREKK